MLSRLLVLGFVSYAAAAEPFCDATQQRYLDAGCCGEGQATVCVAPTLPGLTVTRTNFDTMEDINGYNPLNADEAACGAYSIPFTVVNDTSTLNGTQLYLTLLVTKLNCIGSFGTSPDPYNESAILYTFPPLYVVNYARHTQSSGAREDTCTFYAKTPFAFAPPLLQPTFGLNETTTPVSNGFFEQGSCKEYNATSNKFMKFVPNYYYNFSDAEYPASDDFISNFGLREMLSAHWYRQTGITMDRWDV